VREGYGIVFLRVVDGRHGESGQDPGAKGGVDSILLDLPRPLPRQLPKIHRALVPIVRGHDELRLDLMTHEVGLQALGIALDEVAELDKDGELDVVWAEDQQAVLVVRLDDGVHKTVRM
jgi:hypothetical protein